MTDDVILKRDIDLNYSECILNREEKDDFMKLQCENTSAFSLHREAGNCQHQVKLDLKDKSPFYIRPYHASEQDKVIIQTELQKL